MSENMGIWIDHRKAVLVTERADGMHIETILSNVEKHAQRTGDSPLQGPYEALQVPADDKRQRALTEHLNGYYDIVIAKTAAAGSLFIFGPGEAKGELSRRLVHKLPKAPPTSVEAADRLTDQQIGAKVRLHFKHVVS